jgi:hypothetical protein
VRGGLYGLAAGADGRVRAGLLLDLTVRVDRPSGPVTTGAALHADGAAELTLTPTLTTTLGLPTPPADPPTEEPTATPARDPAQPDVTPAPPVPAPVDIGADVPAEAPAPAGADAPEPAEITEGAAADVPAEDPEPAGTGDAPVEAGGGEVVDVPAGVTAMSVAAAEEEPARDSDPGPHFRARVTAQDHDDRERPPPQVFCAPDVLTPEQAAAARPGDSVAVPAAVTGRLQSWQLPPATRVVTVLEAWTFPVPAGTRFRVVSVTTEPLAPDVFVVTLQEEQ